MREIQVVKKQRAFRLHGLFFLGLGRVSLCDEIAFATASLTVMRVCLPCYPASLRLSPTLPAVHLTNYYIPDFSPSVKREASRRCLTLLSRGGFGLIRT